MSNNSRVNNSRPKANKTAKLLMITVLGVIVLVAGLFLSKGLKGGSVGTAEVSGDLTIIKSEVSQNAKFYPYKAGNIYMEVIAVKADDGTIRTALNTCQVCYDSGRGYYEQDGNELVCQNCRNRFRIDQVEKVRGGCNPLPILKDSKNEDDENIVISGQFLAENKSYFNKWKRK